MATRTLGHSLLDSENPVIYIYNNPRSISDIPQGSYGRRLPLNTHWAAINCLRVPLDMHFFLVFILTSLPFLTAAVPLAESPAPHGIAVPITKRGNPNGVVDISKLQSNIRRSVA